VTEDNGRSGDHGEPVAIIGIACRFPGARDPAEFHDLAAAGRGMFQPAAALPGRPLRAAVLVRAADARAAKVPVYAEIAGWSTTPAGSERPGPVLLQAAGPAVSGGTLATRPAAGCVPRTRCAQETDPCGPSPAGAMSGAGAGNPARSVT
jgi:hypothetical protein